MKYGIIIQDLDRDQVDEVLAKLDGEAVSVLAGGNEGEFDSKGMPWDERIHAGTKAKNKDGSWKAKRGVDDATFAAVEQELRSRVAAAPVAPVMPTAPAAPVAPETIEQKLARAEQSVGITPPTAPAAPAAPVAPTAPVAPPAAPVAAAPTAPAAPAAPVAPTRDFNGLMAFISNLFRTNAITTPNPHAYPDTIVTRINQGFNITTVTTLTDIANDANMVNYAWQCIDVDKTAGIIKVA